MWSVSLSLQKATVQKPLVISEQGSSLSGQYAPHLEHGSKAEQALDTEAVHGAKTWEFWLMETFLYPMKVM